VRLATVDARPTAVVAQTTTWQEFPGVWLQLPDEVYAVVRSRHLAGADDGAPKWQNVMLHKDDQPSVEVGVLAPESFEGEGRVIASALPAGRTASAIHRGDSRCWAARTMPCAGSFGRRGSR
jgi:hypothetical protein